MQTSVPCLYISCAYPYECSVLLGTMLEYLLPSNDCKACTVFSGTTSEKPRSQAWTGAIIQSIKRSLHLKSSTCYQEVNSLKVHAVH